MRKPYPSENYYVFLHLHCLCGLDLRLFRSYIVLMEHERLT